MTSPSVQPIDDPGRVPIHRLPLVRGLAVAEAMSSFGTTVALIGVAYLSFQGSRSVVQTVLVSAAYSLPTALFGVPAARVTARVSHRQLLLVCNGLKMLVYGGLALLALMGTLSVTILMVASAMAGALAAFTTPGWFELERDVIPPDRLDEANALFGAGASAAAVLGAFVGGFLLGTVGPWSMFLIDALSFLGFIVVLGRAHPKEIRATSERTVGLRDAMRYVADNQLLRRAFLRAALLSLLVAPVAQLLPAVAVTLSTTSSSLGILTAAFSAGALTLAYLIGWLRAKYTRVAILNLTFIVAGLVLFLFGLFGDEIEGRALWVVVLSSLVPLGLLLALAQSVLNAIVVVKVEPNMEGAVFSLYAIVYTVLAPIGGIALGTFADQHDVWGALKLSGAIVFTLSTLALAVWHWSSGAVAIVETPPAYAHPSFDAMLRGHVLHLHRHRRSRQ